MDFKDIKFDGDIDIADNRKKIALRNENKEVIGVALFDVEDNTVYQKLLEIVDVLTNGAKKEKDIDVNIEEISSENLETLEDFEKINEQFSKMRDTFNLRAEVIDEVIKKTDEIFGEGVSDIVMLGGKNINNILPLIKTAMNLIKPERDKKTNPYKRTQKSGVLK